MHAAEGSVREHYRIFPAWLAKTPPSHLARKRAEADMLLHRVGITFAVYGEEAGTGRLIPFDIVPRIIPANELAAVLDVHRRDSLRHGESLRKSRGAADLSSYDNGPAARS